MRSMPCPAVQKTMTKLALGKKFNFRFSTEDDDRSNAGPACRRFRPVDRVFQDDVEVAYCCKHGHPQGMVYLQIRFTSPISIFRLPACMDRPTLQPSCSWTPSKLLLYILILVSSTQRAPRPLVGLLAGWLAITSRYVFASVVLCSAVRSFFECVALKTPSPCCPKWHPRSAGLRDGYTYTRAELGHPVEHLLIAETVMGDE